jgi:thymidylate synthase
MVNTITGKSMNDIFIKTANTLLEQGNERETRGMKTKELMHAWLVLEDTTKSIVTLPARNIDINYLMGELEWYESGSLNVEDISQHSKFWDKLSDTNGTVNSNYGFLTHKEKHAGKSQIEWCIDRLKADPDTRQAIMNYNQPRHKYEGNKDFVCTISQQFIMDDGKLDTIVLMRSNDLIYGLTYDAPWFTRQLDTVAKETGQQPGKYHHYATSLHVYEKHYQMLEWIAASKGDYT